MDGSALNGSADNAECHIESDRLEPCDLASAWRRTGGGGSPVSRSFDTEL